MIHHRTSAKFAEAIGVKHFLLFGFDAAAGNLFGMGGIKTFCGAEGTA